MFPSPLTTAASKRAPETRRNNLRFGTSVCVFGTTLGLLLTGLVVTRAQTPPPPHDAMVKNGPPVWDANHDGVFTCDEWKAFADRIFASADRNHDGKLDPTEFATVQKADSALADADFGYFDENQDGKITQKEFVESPIRSSCASTGTATVASPLPKSRRPSIRKAARRDQPSGPTTGFTDCARRINEA
jgi:hypothetical protein